MRLFSKGCEYAIRVLTQIPPESNGKNFSVKEICQRAGMPLWFTRKMLRLLVERKLLIATQGPGGGYRFAKSPKKISVLNIIEAVDGAGILEQCVMGLRGCNDGNQCALHGVWKNLRSRIVGELTRTSLFQQIKGTKRQN